MGLYSLITRIFSSIFPFYFSMYVTALMIASVPFSVFVLDVSYTGFESYITILFFQPYFQILLLKQIGYSESPCITPLPAQQFDNQVPQRIQRPSLVVASHLPHISFLLPRSWCLARRVFVVFVNAHRSYQQLEFGEGFVDETPLIFQAPWSGADGSGTLTITDYYTQIHCQSDTSALWLVWAGYLDFGVPATVAQGGRLPRLWTKRTTTMKRRRPPGQMWPTLESHSPRATTPLTTKHSHNLIIKVPIGISSIACLNNAVVPYSDDVNLLLNSVVINIT